MPVVIVHFQTKHTEMNLRYQFTPSLPCQHKQERSRNIPLKLNDDKIGGMLYKCLLGVKEIL